MDRFNCWWRDTRVPRLLTSRDAPDGAITRDAGPVEDRLRMESCTDRARRRVARAMRRCHCGLGCRWKLERFPIAVACAGSATIVRIQIRELRENTDAFTSRQARASHAAPFCADQLTGNVCQRNRNVNSGTRSSSVGGGSTTISLWESRISVMMNAVTAAAPPMRRPVPTLSSSRRST